MYIYLEGIRGLLRCTKLELRLDHQQLGLQLRQGLVAVQQLGALLRALHGDAGGHVRHTDTSRQAPFMPLEAVSHLVLLQKIAFPTRFPHVFHGFAMVLPIFCLQTSSQTASISIDMTRGPVSTLFTF